MLEDADISYIAARYSPPLLSGRECEEKWVGAGGGEEVIEAECSDPAACTGIRQNTVQASLSNTLLQNTVKASSPNTLVLFGSGGTAAELPFGTSARSQNTLIGPNTTQQTGQGSPTHTGTIKKIKHALRWIAGYRQRLAMFCLFHVFQQYCPPLPGDICMKFQFYCFQGYFPMEQQFHALRLTLISTSILFPDLFSLREPVKNVLAEFVR